MNTGKPYDTDINTFDNEKFVNINSKDISQQPNKPKTTTITTSMVLSMK